MKLIGAWACVALLFAIGITTRLQHPDMSETRLMLEFWPRWIVAAWLAFMAVLCMRGRW